MDLSPIPKLFWHSISLSLLFFSFAASYVIWRSEGLEVRYKDFNFNTSAQLIKASLKADAESLIQGSV